MRSEGRAASWAPPCWRHLEKVVGALQASFDLAPDLITTDDLIPIIMRETSIEELGLAGAAAIRTA